MLLRNGTTFELCTTFTSLTVHNGQFLFSSTSLIWQLLNASPAEITHLSLCPSYNTLGCQRKGKCVNETGEEYRRKEAPTLHLARGALETTVQSFPFVAMHCLGNGDKEANPILGMS